MTRLVHISDWHGHLKQLPEADVYVCTGDMYRNFPEIEARSSGRFSHRRDMDLWSRTIVPAKEAQMQLAEAQKGFQMYPFLGSPQAPIVCVRGNHDFIDISEMFRGCQEVHEIHSPSDTFTVAGLKFGGMRGINFIANEWSDELQKPDADQLMEKLPKDLDVLVTHAPPAGILDWFGQYGGMDCLATYAMRQNFHSGPLKLHCFGHIHERGGKVEKLGDITFSNAACSVNVIDI